MSPNNPTRKRIKVQKVKINEDLKAKRISVAENVESFNFNKRRIRMLSKCEEIKKGSAAIVYWMSRDQRVQDNWAFLFAQRLGFKHKIPLHVVFCLVPKFLDATIRHYDFMINGLKNVEDECKELCIPFHLLLGEAKEVLPSFVRELDVGGLVTDFSPLRVPQKWIKDLLLSLPVDVPLCQVDAHNIVPCWIASDKQEYSARTIRKKIHDKLPEFFTEFPPVVKHPYPTNHEIKRVDWNESDKMLKVDRKVLPIKWCKPGTQAGLQTLQQFCDERLKFFADKRNDPNFDALSNLSPWLHFGQISAQRCALEAKRLKKHWSASVEAFIEESVVRRELADNFCFYQEDYDSVAGAPRWAQLTLEEHRKDIRDHTYSREALENAQTHDNLWNAAQIQMVEEGKMHGFLRMYWAKKILEWSPTPEEALCSAIYLNDKYSVDGRDPNGYVGCMWSICGVHDQGWAERPIFGKIRFMNYQGCKRKFDVASFESKYCSRKKKKN